ncbi:hypothetical protein [Propionibacterium freudenreichii]|uniref:hypothetical protein n=1 Tax=Propionibacterium freudenreichii TaxID=1744 RepID=UPI001109A196|nr:hypothetical protein [Propionibacterium freudenreichii]MDK9352050.1 hypothetical protein [Propionibacterium freudenreichii]
MLDHKKIRNLVLGAIALVVVATVVIVIAIEHAATRREKAEGAAASSASVFWNGTPQASKTSAASPSRDKLQQAANVVLKVVSWSDGDGTKLGATDPMLDDNVAQTYKAPWPDVLSGKTGAQVYMLGASTDPNGDHNPTISNVQEVASGYQTTMTVASKWRVTWWEQPSGDPSAQSATEKSVTANGRAEWNIIYDWASDKIVAIGAPNASWLRTEMGS